MLRLAPLACARHALSRGAPAASAAALPPRLPRRAYSSAAPAFTGMSDAGLSETQKDVREAVGAVCKAFGDDYWLERDREHSYPHELYAALQPGGWLGVALPEKHGGAGLGIGEAMIMLETIAESGAGFAGAQSIHANIYPNTIAAEFGTPSQQAAWLPGLIDGRIRSGFAVTEPTTGLETLKLRTRAERRNGGWVINGQKIWTSSAQVASHLVVLARTAPPSETSRSSGLSLFFAPIRDAPNAPGVAEQQSALRKGVEMRRIEKMGGNCVDANEIWFDDFEVDEGCLIGPAENEGKGFKMVLHGMNAERCLIAGEALGLGYAALIKAVKYAKERVVFGKAIGGHQAIQHQLSRAFIELEAAKHLVLAAARSYDAREAAVGAQANSAKYFAAEAAWKACETAVLVHGGMGYAKEYHVERYMREAMAMRLAPISKEMLLNYVGQSVLGLPKSY